VALLTTLAFFIVLLSLYLILFVLDFKRRLRLTTTKKEVERFVEETKAKERHQ
jgi:hypothetical protein